VAIITITKSTGSYGGAIASELAAALGFELIDRGRMLTKFLKPWADPADLRRLEESPKYFLTETKEHITYKEYLEGALHEMAARQDAVLVGFGSVHFFAGDKNALHVNIDADLDDRIGRIAKRRSLDRQEAKLYVEQKDRLGRRFTNTLFGVSTLNLTPYHIVLNTSRLGISEAVNTIAALHDNLATKRRLAKENHPAVSVHIADFPKLKNEAEIEFAKLLNRYDMEWRYEPKTFPVEWDESGRVTLAFSPDFYLPRFNLYLELTTMNQKYVTMKNKKARKLRELYGVDVRIVYRRDFLAMMERFEIDEEK
jgi:cytidylate kinase